MNINQKSFFADTKKKVSTNSAAAKAVFDLMHGVANKAVDLKSITTTIRGVAHKVFGIQTADTTLTARVKVDAAKVTDTNTVTEAEKVTDKVTLDLQDGNTVNCEAFTIMMETGEVKALKVKTTKGKTTYYFKDNQVIVIEGDTIYYLDAKNRFYIYNYDRVYKKRDNGITRCENEAHESFDNYGAKDICLSEEWRHSPIKFVLWALFDSNYADGLMIDRINPAGIYQSTNSRFITSRESANNKSNNIYLEVFGIKDTLSFWSEKSGIPYQNLKYIHNKNPKAAIAAIKRRLIDL